jgi:hypothetical protein
MAAEFEWELDGAFCIDWVEDWHIGAGLDRPLRCTRRRRNVNDDTIDM